MMAAGPLGLAWQGLLLSPPASPPPAQAFEMRAS